MTIAASECATCAALAAAGVNTEDREVCPTGEELLEVFGPGEGHYKTWQLRRCRDCGTLYRYCYHSEYDVTGSWDDYSLWRLEDPAQAPVRALMAAPASERDAALVEALRHSSAQAREATALLAWIWVCEGQALDASVRATARALLDEVHMVRMFAYRTLRAFIERGRDEAALALAALEAEVPDDKESAPILLRDCRQQLGLPR